MNSIGKEPTQVEKKKTLIRLTALKSIDKKQIHDDKCEKMEYESTEKKLENRKERHQMMRIENIDRKQINITIYVSCGF